MSPADPAATPGLRGVLSEPRLAPYLARYQGREDLALRLYAWNAALAAALWGPFGIVEVTVRNAIHARLADRTGRPDWWEDQRLWDQLLPNERRSVEDARSSLALRGNASPSADDVVAAANLGLWTGLLSEGQVRHPVHNYEANLWRPRLRAGFPNYTGSRKLLHSELMEIKNIRNRVAHHEPIFKVNLARIIDMIARVTGYVSTDTEAFVRAGERVTGLVAEQRAFVERGDTYL